MRAPGLTAQWHRLPHPLRWVGAAIVGGTLITVGVVLLVLPGPGLVLIALGVAVLATEFAWAEAVLQRMKKAGTAAADTARKAINRRRAPEKPELPGSGDSRP